MSEISINEMHSRLKNMSDDFIDIKNKMLHWAKLLYRDCVERWTFQKKQLKQYQVFLCFVSSIKSHLYGFIFPLKNLLTKVFSIFLRFLGSSVLFANYATNINQLIISLCWDPSMLYSQITVLASQTIYNHYIRSWMAVHQNWWW